MHSMHLSKFQEFPKIDQIVLAIITLLRNEHLECFLLKIECPFLDIKTNDYSDNAHSPRMSSSICQYSRSFWRTRAHMSVLRWSTPVR